MRCYQLKRTVYQSTDIHSYTCACVCVALNCIAIIFYFLLHFHFNVLSFFLYLHLSKFVVKKNWMPVRLESPSNRAADVYMHYISFYSRSFHWVSCIQTHLHLKIITWAPYALNVTHVCTSLYLFIYFIFPFSFIVCTHNILIIHTQQYNRMTISFFSYSFSVI